MNRLAFVSLLILFASAADAADVYRCVTENGVVRYSDTPCEDGQNQKLDIHSEPTDEAAVRERIERRKEQVAALDKAEADARAARQKENEASEERAQQCAAARERLQKLQAARRVRTGEGESQRYLESEEIEARRKEAAEKLAELCGG